MTNRESKVTMLGVYFVRFAGVRIAFVFPLKYLPDSNMSFWFWSILAIIRTWFCELQVSDWIGPNLKLVSIGYASTKARVMRVSHIRGSVYGKIIALLCPHWVILWTQQSQHVHSPNTRCDSTGSSLSTYTVPTLNVTLKAAVSARAQSQH